MGFEFSAFYSRASRVRGGHLLAHTTGSLKHRRLFCHILSVIHRTVIHHTAIHHTVIHHTVIHHTVIHHTVIHHLLLTTILHVSRFICSFYLWSGPLTQRHSRNSCLS